MLCVSLPWPPTVNHYYGRRGKMTYITARGKDYRRSVEFALAGATPETGRLSVFVTAFPPDRRVRDLGNLDKALLDALQHGGAFADDGQADGIVWLRDDVTKGGKVKVMVVQHRTVAQRLAALRDAVQQEEEKKNE